ncbi:MAG: phosphatidylserine decarboxylase family protein [Desulfovibrionaceae bacterium]
MQKSSVGITPEGWPVIGLTALSAFIFALLGCWPMAVIFLVLVWFSCHFFRDPERVVPQAAGLAVSPADGRVIRIDKRIDPISGESRTCVCVFMNVFSVHVNRAPVAGTVTAIHYHPGTFVNAAWDKASTDNERCAYAMRDAAGDHFTFVQIAGLIARRIVCRVAIGDSLERGERFGMIRFGSRLDLYMPEDYSPAIGIGELVFAGQSILARKVSYV